MGLVGVDKVSACLRASALEVNFRHRLLHLYPISLKFSRAKRLLLFASRIIVFSVRLAIAKTDVVLAVAQVVFPIVEHRREATPVKFILVLSSVEPKVELQLQVLFRLVSLFILNIGRFDIKVAVNGEVISSPGLHAEAVPQGVLNVKLLHPLFFVFFRMNSDL